MEENNHISQTVPEEAHSNAAPTPVSDTPVRHPSHFDGITLQLIGWRLLGFFLTLITLGIGASWAQCMVIRWETKHTYVNGKRLYFDGTGLQLLGKYLLWGLLTLITFGIYAFFIPVRMHKWRASHTRVAKSDDDLSGPSGWIIFGGIMASIVAIALIVMALTLLQPQLPALPDNIFDSVLSDSNNSASTSPTFIRPSVNNESTAPTAAVSATEPYIWYVSTAVGLRVRTAPDTGAEAIETLKYGTPVTVEHWDGKWAYIGYGWCHGDYLSQTAPSPQSQTGSQTGTQTGTIDPSILGTWHEVAPCAHPYDDNGIAYQFYGKFVFNSDGTFIDYPEYATWEYDPETGAATLLTEKTFGNICEGTFTYDGEELILTVTVDHGHPDRPMPCTTVHDVTISGDIMYAVIDGDREYERGTEAEIMSRLYGPTDTPAPSTPAEPTVPPGATVLDPAIFGTWTNATYDPSIGRLLTNTHYSFAGDGTFTGAYSDRTYLYSTTEGWIYDYSAGAGGEGFGGTYRYQDGILELTFTYMEWSDPPAPITYYASIDGDVLYINSTPYYPGNVNEIGNRLCPDPISGEAALLDSAIFGTWYEFLRNPDGDQLFYPVIYTFNSDGTYSRSTQDSYFTYSPETGLSHTGSGAETGYGFYTYSNGVLTFGTQKINVTISGDLLYMYDDILYRTDDIWAYAQNSLSPQ